MIVATLAATLLLLTPIVAGAQEPAPQPTAPGAPVAGAPGATSAPRARNTDQNRQSGSATIRGQVVHAGTGQPLRRVQVRAFSKESRGALTDDNGRYEIVDLPAGSYTLSADKGGYVPMQYGQRRPFRAGRPMTLADRQTLEKIDFALSPGGVIAGRIGERLSPWLHERPSATGGGREWKH